MVGWGLGRDGEQDTSCSGHLCQECLERALKKYRNQRARRLVYFRIQMI